MATAPLSNDNDANNSNELMDKAVQHLTENSEVKGNGVRVVSTKGYFAGLEERHGVTRDEIKRVQDAQDFENTAAARVALADLEGKVTASSDEDLKSEDYRKTLRSTVRLPTHNGSTEVTVKAETHNNIPRRAGDDSDAPTKKISYGSTDTYISTKSRIHSDFHTEAQERMRKALKIGD